MRRCPPPSILALSLLGIAGCGPAPVVPARAPESLAVVRAPVLGTESSLALLGPQGAIRVGDAPDDALKAVPAPRGSFEFSSLPRKFGREYRGRGWDTGTQGFGIIVFQNVVVLAMLQEDLESPARLSELQARYAERFGQAPAISGESANYWFWEEGGRRLMLAGYQDEAGKVHMTAAIGDFNTMDALGMSPDLARRDLTRLQSLMRQRRDPQNR